MKVAIKTKYDLSNVLKSITIPEFKFKIEKALGIITVRNYNDYPLFNTQIRVDLTKLIGAYADYFNKVGAKFYIVDEYGVEIPFTLETYRWKCTTNWNEWFKNEWFYIWMKDNLDAKSSKRYFIYMTYENKVTSPDNIFELYDDFDTARYDLWNNLPTPNNSVISFSYLTITSKRLFKYKTLYIVFTTSGSYMYAWSRRSTYIGFRYDGRNQVLYQNPYSGNCRLISCDYVCSSINIPNDYRINGMWKFLKLKWLKDYVEVLVNGKYYAKIDTNICKYACRITFIGDYNAGLIIDRVFITDAKHIDLDVDVFVSPNILRII